MSSPPTSQTPDAIRHSLETLSAAVREMTPTGTRSIPLHPLNFNLLARPPVSPCRVCNLPGHSSNNVQNAALCRIAIVSLIGFWEDIAAHVVALYQGSERFKHALEAVEPKYAMRLDGGIVMGGDLEGVLVDRLVRAWLKFQAYFARIRPKANVMLGDDDKERLEGVSRRLNGYFLNGSTLTDLFERSLEGSA